MAKKKSSPLSFIIILCVVLALLLTVAELGTRFFLAQEIKKEFVSSVEEQGVEKPVEPQVGFGLTPVLFGLVTGSLAEVNLDAPASLNSSPSSPSESPKPGNNTAATLSGQPALNIRAQGVTVDLQNPVVDLLHVTTEIPTEMLLAEVQKAVSSSTGNNGGNGIADSLLSNLTVISNLTANEQQQTLDFEMSKGLFTISMTPQVQEGVLSFSPSHASVMGVQIKDSMVQDMQNALTQVIDQVAGLKFQSARITKNGLEVSIQGTDVSLRDLDTVASVNIPG